MGYVGYVGRVGRWSMTGTAPEYGTAMARGVQHERPWIPRALVAILVLAIGGAAVLGAASSSSNRSATSPIPLSNPNGFGGYVWRGQVTAVGAQWRVPSVSASAAIGWSGTWIGVQGRSGQFIQLGTYSNQAPGLAGTGPQYGVFYSDTTAGFRALTITRLSRPGDRIAFAMHETSTGWALDVHDLTAGWAKHLDVPYRPGGTYNLAEWIQEDPSEALSSGTNAPYAVTSVVSVDHLAVDGRPPHLSYLDASALLTSNGVYLVPTAEVDDGFTLAPAHGFERQYLQDVQASDAKLSALLIPVDENDFSVLQAGGQLSPAALANLRVVIGQVASVYAKVAMQLGEQSWPARALPAIQREERVGVAYAAMLRAWAADQGSVQSLPGLLHYLPFRRAVTQARHALGLPDAQ